MKFIAVYIHHPGAVCLSRRARLFPQVFIKHLLMPYRVRLVRQVRHASRAVTLKHTNVSLFLIVVLIFVSFQTKFHGNGYDITVTVSFRILHDSLTRTTILLQLDHYLIFVLHYCFSFIKRDKHNHSVDPYHSEPAGYRPPLHRPAEFPVGFWLTAIFSVIFAHKVPHTVTCLCFTGKGTTAIGSLLVNTFPSTCQSPCRWSA